MNYVDSVKSVCPLLSLVEINIHTNSNAFIILVNVMPFRSITSSKYPNVIR